MDLSDDEAKRAFSLFINERKRQLNLSNEKLAADLGCNLKTVQRYMALHKQEPGETAVRSIPDKTYIDFLTALKSSHEEFEAFRAQQLTQNKQDQSAQAPSQSHGTGAMHIGSIQISGQARIDRSPIGAQTVNYNFGPEDSSKKT